MNRTLVRCASRTILSLTLSLAAFSHAAAAVVVVAPNALGKGEGQQEQQPGSNAATTLDAWKEALPESEVATTEAVATPAARTAVEAEKEVADLEHQWMEAVKRRDRSALSRILSREFTISNAQLAEGLATKSRYIKDSMLTVKLESYSFDKLIVRVYENTAVVNARYKQRAAVSGEDRSGEFLLTDVWVKRGGRWRAITRHFSPAAAAAAVPPPQQQSPAQPPLPPSPKPGARTRR